jgi:hypothetical protein
VTHETRDGVLRERAFDAYKKLPQITFKEHRVTKVVGRKITGVEQQ